MILKQLNKGRTIEGLPARAVLRHADTPGAVTDALGAWHEAVACLKEPTLNLRAAEKAAQESTLQVRGERERYDAEIREKTRDEARALRAAEGTSTRAANALIDVLKEYAEPLSAIAARLSVEAHMRAVEAYEDLASALAGRVARAGLAEGVDARLATGRGMGPGPVAQVGTMLDEVDVRGWLDAAGMTAEDFGLVEIRPARDAFRRLTTARRAARLTGNGSKGAQWRYVNEEVSV